MEQFGKIIPLIVEGTDPADANWKPASGNWSIVEIISHLVDEEKDDFRTRLKLTLNNPLDPWPTIDPEGAAIERKYFENDLREVTDQFVAERDESVKWLRSLTEPNWTIAYNHPQIGSMRCGDILAAWVAHDQLHLRQLAKRRFELVQRDAGEFKVDYAGDW